MKAGELLRVMQAKDMFPRGEKDFATPQAETPANGSAGR